MIPPLIYAGKGNLVSPGIVPQVYQHGTSKLPLASLSRLPELFKRTMDLLAVSHYLDFKELIAIDAMSKNTKISERTWRGLFFRHNQVYLKSHSEMPFPTNCKAVYLQMKRLTFALCYNHNPDLIMRRSADMNCIEMVDFIASYSPASVHQKFGAINITLLTRAVKDGDTRLVRLLLKHGAKTTDRSLVFQHITGDMPGTLCSNERTPLMIAIDNGHVEIVRILLQSGADIEERDTYGQTAFMHAALRILAMENDDIVVRNDLYGPYISIKRSSDNPENRRSIEIFNILLEYHPDIDARGAAFERSVLMHAICLKKVGMVNVLLKLGANIYTVDREGITALRYAQEYSQHYSPSIADQLIAADHKIKRQRALQIENIARKRPRKKENG